MIAMTGDETAMVIRLSQIAGSWHATWHTAPLPTDRRERHRSGGNARC